MRCSGILLGLSFALWSAPATVGEFRQDVRQTFGASQGLPSEDVRCVAAAGKKVWAGTAQGLTVFENGTWSPLGKAVAVDACTVSGQEPIWVSGATVYRGSAEAGTLPPAVGSVHAVAALDSRLLIGADSGLFEFDQKRRSFIPIAAFRGAVFAIALGSGSQVAVGASTGLFTRQGAEWIRELPRDEARSWAPVDVRGLAYDKNARLWFFSRQGAGVRGGESWKLFTGSDGLPYDDATSLATGPEGEIWLGTAMGAIRYDGRIWAYRQGRRWLPDDAVRAVAVDADGDAWFATAKGVGRITPQPTTLARKARFYEDEIDKRHRRTEYEYVMEVRLPVSGDLSKWEQSDSDNDGLWTSMYGAGECFAYAATKDPAAKQRATKAFEALRFLSLVTQGGEHPAPPGFPARAILPTSGSDPNIHDSRERDTRTRAGRDHLWKIMSPRWPKSADGKWYWKTDTSSDELDGHYFFYARYYDLVAETEKEKDAVRAVVRAITDHLLTHNLSLVDWDGQPTRWAVFDPASLNDNRMWWNGRGLNSLSILSYLKVAEHMTGDPKYGQAYDRLVREHKYATNVLMAKLHAGPGSGNQSDDEMAFMCYYNLLRYETDDDLVQKYAGSLANYWALERPERNPFFNFAAIASLTGRKFTDAFRTLDLTPSQSSLDDSVDTLRRLPLDRVNWGHKNSHRKDVVPLRTLISEDDDRPRTGHLRDGKVLPVDERYFSFWNHNPWILDSHGSGNALGDGAVFLLPYYMGVYHGFLKE